jgi:hypothetical protein
MGFLGVLSVYSVVTDPRQDPRAEKSAKWGHFVPLKSPYPGTMRQTVSWTRPAAQGCSPVTRGIAKQWAVHYGGALPDMLVLLGASPRWIAAIVRARACAASDSAARAELDAFDRELAIVTGVALPRWPKMRPVALAAAGPELSALDPAQVLLLCGRLGQRSAATRAAIESLLAAAFGGHDAEWSSEMRARLCTDVIPESLRPRWRAGLGLAPPDAVAPGVHRGGMRMLEAALDGAEVRAVHEEVFAPLSSAAALDLLMTALVVRAALRCAGDLPRADDITRPIPVVAAPEDITTLHRMAA